MEGSIMNVLSYSDLVPDKQALGRKKGLDDDIIQVSFTVGFQHYCPAFIFL